MPTNMLEWGTGIPGGHRNTRGSQEYQGVTATPNPSALNVGVFYPVNSVCIQVDGFFFLLKTIKEI